MNSEALTCSLRECAASDWYKFPKDHRCPHDAWVESITVTEPSSDDRHQNRKLEIHIRLLAGYHDGMIEFIYKGVREYSIRAMRKLAGHGDWLDDDVDTSRHDSLVHKINLVNGSLEIEANDIEYRWTPLPAIPPLSS